MKQTIEDVKSALAKALENNAREQEFIAQALAIACALSVEIHADELIKKYESHT